MTKFISNEQIKLLVKQYQSPIYIYDEQTIIDNINLLKKLLVTQNCHLNYATKANSNLEILKLIRKMGLGADATGISEIYTNKMAGFEKDKIYCVGNNFTKDELLLLIEEDIMISLDSLDQLSMLGELRPGYSKIMLRMNPSFGEGENKSIITGGQDQKFGIDYDDFDLALSIIKKYDLNLIGLNQHIGSSYLDASKYIKATKEFLEFITTTNIHDLKVIDLGGGFGINYKREHSSESLDFDYLHKELSILLHNFIKNYDNKDIRFEFEPGRFIMATSAILIGEVTSIKKREQEIFVGTNVGFTSLVRPTLYNSYHEIEFITTNTKKDIVSVVGNICESGDYMCKKRELIVPNRDDLVIIKDVGAYGYCLTSNYNNKLKPIEILKTVDNQYSVIRKRQTFEDLLNLY